MKIKKETPPTPIPHLPSSHTYPDPIPPLISHIAAATHPPSRPSQTMPPAASPSPHRFPHTSGGDPHLSISLSATTDAGQFPCSPATLAIAWQNMSSSRSGGSFPPAGFATPGLQHSPTALPVARVLGWRRIHGWHVSHDSGASSPTSTMPPHAAPRPDTVPRQSRPRLAASPMAGGSWMKLKEIPNGILTTQLSSLLCDTNACPAEIAAQAAAATTILIEHMPHVSSLTTNTHLCMQVSTALRFSAHLLPASMTKLVLNLLLIYILCSLTPNLELLLWFFLLCSVAVLNYLNSTELLEYFLLWQLCVPDYVSLQY